MNFSNLIVQTMTKLLVVLILVYFVAVLFGGHHKSGGGFIGGLIAAAALVLLYMVFDVESVSKFVQVDFRIVGAIGLLIAILMGTGALLFNAPFLSQTFTHRELPLFGDTELATAMIFDIGVYLTVIGTTMTIILSISEDG